MNTELTQSTDSANPIRAWPPIRRWAPAAFLAVLLTAIAWSVVTIVQFDRALASVAERGGHVFVRQSPAFVSSRILGWYSVLIGDTRVIADLQGSRVTDADVRRLRGLGVSLTSLRLGGARVTDAGVTYLCEYSGIECVSLQHTGVTDAGLARLAALGHLMALELAGTQVTDAGLLHLGGLREMTRLDVADTRVTDAGMAILAGWPRLKVLDLSHTGITDDSLERLHQAAHLASLNLSGSHITDAGLTYLEGLRCLDTLDLSSTGVGDIGVKHLAGLTNLGHLDLAGAVVTDAGLQYLAGLKNLTWVSLHGSRVKGSALKSLQRIRGEGNMIQFLDLSSSAVTDSGLQALEDGFELKGLCLADTTIGDAGLVHINTRSLDVGCHVNLSRTRVTDAGIDVLGRIQGIGTVDLEGTRVTAAGQKRLRKLLSGHPKFDED
jgi:hypothetical protein